MHYIYVCGVFVINKSEIFAFFLLLERNVDPHTKKSLLTLVYYNNEINNYECTYTIKNQHVCIGPFVIIRILRCFFI